MVLAVYRSEDSGLKNLEKKNHGVGSEVNLSVVSNFLGSLHSREHYSWDIDKHNGGELKVFERKGGKLVRIGTADEYLNIYKK